MTTLKRHWRAMVAELVAAILAVGLFVPYCDYDAAAREGRGLERQRQAATIIRALKARGEKDEDGVRKILRDAEQGASGRIIRSILCDLEQAGRIAKRQAGATFWWPGKPVYSAK